MAMFIVKPWYRKAVNPDDYFDPVTHIATEENFIKFLECGVYDSKYIGYKVQLSNSSGYYNNGIWVIADVNHDSANTGQTNCYDLIAEKCFNQGSTYGASYWRDSYSRSFLNGTFKNGIGTDMKNHMLNIKYYSQNAWYNDDQIIIPSFRETNGDISQFVYEGTPYPIFTNDNSRQKLLDGTSSTQYWWTRTNFGGSYTSRILIILPSGVFDNRLYSQTGIYTVPLIRVH